MKYPNRSASAIDQLRRRAASLIAKWRESFTLEEIATVLDVSKGTAWRWEHGEALPYRRTAEHIVGNKASILKALKANRA